MRHKRVSCSPSNLAALAIGIALANVSMKASNNSVKPEPARAHGVTTLWTPHSGHLTLGVRACNSVRCWKKSRCRQVSSFVSWTAQPSRPHCAQANRLPRGKSTYKSSRPSTASNALRVTTHGDERPRANWKRSVSCIPSG